MDWSHGIMLVKHFLPGITVMLVSAWAISAAYVYYSDKPRRNHKR